jgi:hypothetical protein
MTRAMDEGRDSRGGVTAALSGYHGLSPQTIYRAEFPAGAELGGRECRGASTTVVPSVTVSSQRSARPG